LAFSSGGSDSVPAASSASLELLRLRSVECSSPATHTAVMVSVSPDAASEEEFRGTEMTQDAHLTAQHLELARRFGVKISTP
jgi:hypothetical protein